MAAFASYLLQLLQNLVIWLYNAGIDIIQRLSDGLAALAMLICSFLPDVANSLPSAGDAPTSTVATLFLQTLNWIFPISFLISIVAWLVFGMLLYYAIAPLARWAKLLN